MISTKKVLLTGVNGLIGGRIFERISRDYAVTGSSKGTGSYVSNEFDLNNIGQIRAWLNRLVWKMMTSIP